jgi:hypothetical protein
MAGQNPFFAIIILAWRLIRLICFVRTRSVIAADTAVSRPPASFLTGLSWTAVGALTLIGVPLATSDPLFMAQASRDVATLITVVPKVQALLGY